MAEARAQVAQLELGRRTVTVTVVRRADGESWCELAASWSRRDGQPVTDTTRLRPRQITALVAALEAARARLGGSP